MFGVEFNRNQKLAIFVLIGLCVIGISYSHLVTLLSGRDTDIVLQESGADQGVPIVAQDSDQPPTVTELRNSGKVICHVTGCVKTPGVYTLEEGQRVIDAIHAAGGPSSGADLQALNLAAKVEDGSRIEVPPLIESAGHVATSTGQARKGIHSHRLPQSSSGKLVTPGEGLVRLNTAGLEELQRLPGVGPATAEKIIEYRRACGGFRRIEQIMDVSGIGPKKYEKMRPFLAL